MESKVYNKEGKEVSKVEVPEAIFGLPWNGDLVHQVIVSLRSSSRASIAHSQDRSDVRGGGKKPWRQKGTGRSRHGSNRSPLWKGGGVTFGPRNERNFERKVNRKMKNKALNTILSQKMRDGEIIFIDSIKMDEIKTKKAREIINSISKGSENEMIFKKKKNAALITTSQTQPEARKSFANFNNIKFDEIRNINPVELANYRYLIIEDPEKSLETLNTKTK